MAVKTGVANLTEKLDALRHGGKRALSRALTRLETEEGSQELAALLDHAAAQPGGHVLGLTGPPGVGKSSLTDCLIRHYRALGERVCVLAIDPSSRFTGGALLGDRTRLSTDPEDQNIFVRSMAARDRLGGLSDHAIAAIALMRAVCDRVIVESVGIGQSESDLVQASDTVVLCIQPGSGDSLQFMKAGIMELPDVIVITKADMGALARRAASDVTGALSLTRSRSSDWTAPVCEVSSRDNTGIETLSEAIASHQDYLAGAGRGQTKRAAQHTHWVEDMIRTRFGGAGLAVAGRSGADWRLQPFTAFHDISADLQRRLNGQ
ncbi:methylmalonyl Co-A mutase-associated GTPase MeaB [Roseibium sp. RKSG952]|uniref:methylmalonyl Co-A mutase-associated GTPase MeaB n=1 Tax=Roseibium sp. RKSG952 TaxID=2529384 RepID=UPI0012BCC2D6|nr:methylmalonyl Co-A mutase-associated GTPase MeaB [Roseibium sp. RKSG952]MTH99433.1 methylmalonyl Co-A mutase-associated GTPase MeaB [Roseibium sp. RKSG952]